MAVTAKALAFGSAPSSIAGVYTAPGATTTAIVSAVFHNTDSSTHTIEMYIRVSGSDYQLLEIDIEADGSLFFNERVVLETGSIIRLVADTGSVVTYYISGIEMT